ncbi:MAG TPA: cytochrome P450 [Solirubrobacteraceae bacterium]|nr:cytochrome P450 [Solirubrobacteraceae bacterium]
MSKRYGVPPIAPLTWLARNGATTLAVLAGGDVRLTPEVTGIPGDMFSLPIPAFASKFVVPSHPAFKHLVFVGSPELVRQVFAGPPDALHFGVPNPIGKVTGAKSLFSLDEAEHLEQRKLILPPLHGQRMQAYESIAAEETVRELASWPEGREHATTDGFMRITLNIILRAVFGVREGSLMDELREQFPHAVKLGSRLMGMGALQRDLGPRSPYGRFQGLVRRFEWGVNRLIDDARRDPALDDRIDVLALLARARHEDDDSTLTDQEIADQLKAIVAAGHETTANTLAWAVERLQRHPAILRRLEVEADEGGHELRDATIREIQRTRPVIPGTGRMVVKPFELGDYVLPPGTVILLPTPFLHNNSTLYPHPLRFDPDRFLGKRPDPNSWVPFGGGIRRCPGAAFAHMEMDVVLRTLLQTVSIAPSTRRGERMLFRGIAFAPARGGRIVMHRRTVLPADRPGYVAPTEVAA